MKQSSKDRIARLTKGRCPVHGLFMCQISDWFETDKGEFYTIVECPRQDCKIYAFSFNIDGPCILPEEFIDLLDDGLPDPKIIDENTKPHKRRKSLKHLKSKVLNKTGGFCYYCGVEMSIIDMTIDHLIPESKGGDSSIDNLFPACKSCNSSKGTKTLEEFRFLMRMKIFTKIHKVTFSQNQINFLNKIGYKIELPEYKFWFERSCP